MNMAKREQFGVSLRRKKKIELLKNKRVKQLMAVNGSYGEEKDKGIRS